MWVSNSNSESLALPKNVDETLPSNVGLGPPQYLPQLTQTLYESVKLIHILLPAERFW